MGINMYYSIWGIFLLSLLMPRFRAGFHVLTYYYHHCKIILHKLNKMSCLIDQYMYHTELSLITSTLNECLLLFPRIISTLFGTSLAYHVLLKKHWTVMGECMAVSPPPRDHGISFPGLHEATGMY